MGRFLNIALVENGLKVEPFLNASYCKRLNIGLVVGMLSQVGGKN
jgi:hypothetical protein